MLRRIEVRAEGGDQWRGVFREAFHYPERATHYFGMIHDGTPPPNRRLGAESFEILEGTTFYYTEHGWATLRDAFRKFVREMVKGGREVRVVTLDEDHGMGEIYSDAIQKAVA